MRLRTLTVELGERSYPIHVGPGLLGEAPLYSPYVAGRMVALVSNAIIEPLYADAVQLALASCGADVLRVTIPDGESAKSWHTLDVIHGALLRARADRRTVLVALGGGVVGDVVGFAAATYQRGVPYIQVPTTLLAQVDSSVGGKTAINHELGKNMVGAFHQPLAVIADTAALDTLPERELSAGLAEVVKYGAIRDRDFFRWLEGSLPLLLGRDAAALTKAIIRSCEIKAAVVGLDEREAGLRAILNFGHTFGHAIEALEGYGKWLHGEAVGAGMVLATALSVRFRGFPERDAHRIVRLIADARLPTRPPAIPVEAWLDAMGRDKKNESGRISFVLLDALGSAFVERNVPPDMIAEVISATR